MQKIVIFTYPGLHCLPWGRDALVHELKRQFSACQTPRSIYPSIFNSFPVIRNHNAKNRHFYVPRPSLFALGTGCPCGNHAKHCMNWKDNSVLAKPLAAYIHLSSTVSQLFETQVQKIAVFTYRSPHFCFPWRCPCDYHAICCMYGKTIQCLPNPSQHVPIYLQ